jgi:prepilin-type N-terminal cleavage/methylation domain-containing protein
MALKAAKGKMQTSLTTNFCAASSVLRTTDKRGFTLIEILVVVAIIAIMATATAGLYRGTFKNMQLEKTAKEIYLAAKYARLGAVEKQTEFRLVIDKAEGKFFVIYKETDDESEENKDQEERDVIVSNPYTKPGDLPEGVTFEDVTIVRQVQLATDQRKQTNQDNGEIDDEAELEDVIVFTPYGTADSAVIKIANSNTSFTVSISPATGKVKIGRGENEMPLDIIDLDEMEKGNKSV